MKKRMYDGSKSTIEISRPCCGCGRRSPFHSYIERDGRSICSVCRAKLQIAALEAIVENVKKRHSVASALHRVAVDYIAAMDALGEQFGGR